MNRLGETQRRVLTFLRRQHEPAQTTEVALALGMTTDRARSALKRLFKSGLVLMRPGSVENGWYATPDNMTVGTPVLRDEISEA